MSSNNNKLKRFTIDDAFEEETDEAIQIYGSTTIPNDPRVKGASSPTTLTADSRDSDSLIQDPGGGGGGGYDYSVVGLAPGGGGDGDSMSVTTPTRSSCLRHPKVRENWRMVLAAAILLIIGVGLLATGAVSLARPASGLQGAVFLLAGLICFVPGAYHIVYIYLAATGRRGYHFHNLPLFT